MNFSVTKSGIPLSKGKYKWDEETKTFSTQESSLVIDFSGVDGVTFKMRDNCMIKTGNCCTFDAGDNCIFHTGNYCIFQTRWNCTFDTGHNCTFNTGHNCTFKTGWHCTFTTGENCFTTRYDVVHGVTEIPQGKTIKLKDYGTTGYTEVTPTHTIVIDGKEEKNQ